MTKEPSMSTGFVRKDLRCEDCKNNNYSYCSVCRDYVEGEVNPTLKQLIEACGHAFGSLHYYPMRADDGDEPIEEWSVYTNALHGSFNGFTPEEAVTALWNALKKK